MVRRPLADVVWVTYAILYIATIARRKEPHIYVANWYFMAFILVIGDPAHRQQSRAAYLLGKCEEVTTWPGVQDAIIFTMVVWSQHTVAFFLTAGFLGMLYYYLPVARSGADLLLSAVDPQLLGDHLLLHVELAPTHLHPTQPFPTGYGLLGMTFSVMLLMPSGPLPATRC